MFFCKGNSHKCIQNLNKISKIVIDFLHHNVATVWDFNLYFRYDIRERQFHKRSALIISRFYYM